MNTFNIRIDAKLFYGVLLEPWDKWSWNHRTLIINSHSSTVLIDGRVVYHYQKKTRSFKRQYQAWKMDFQSESKILFTTATFTSRLFEGLRRKTTWWLVKQRNSSWVCCHLNLDQHKHQKYGSEILTFNPLIHLPLSRVDFWWDGADFYGLRETDWDNIHCDRSQGAGT